MVRLRLNCRFNHKKLEKMAKYDDKNPIKIESLERDGEMNRVFEQLDMLSQQIVALSQIETNGVPPEETSSIPITVLSGHNMIGYTGTSGVDAAIALQNAISGADVSQISIIKNQAGQFYVPSMGFSTLTMQYGVGYYLYNSGDAFTVNWS